ncbi:MAG: AvrD family protein [Myxococcales bacterium]|nr:AvrD family protein [Myxococcales bacterium]
MQAIRSDVEYFADIDEVLGRFTERFFGNGYRQVRQRLGEVVIDPESASAHASCRIVYPENWSKKKNRELVPHLSSIDAFIVAVRVAELYLRDACGLSEADLAASWMRRCKLRAGTSPSVDLGAVPVGMRHIDTRATNASICGASSRFRVSVGTMEVELCLDHPPLAKVSPTPRSMPEERSDAQNEHRYYGLAYRDTTVRIRDLLIDPRQPRAQARVGLTSPPTVRLGLSSNYLPFVSFVDAVVSVAQVAQALLYRQDGIDRQRSHNLWMRRISFESPSPRTRDAEFSMETWIEKTQVLRVRDQRWRTADFGLTYPGATATYSLAHQLPETSLTTDSTTKNVRLRTGER